MPDCDPKIIRKKEHRINHHGSVELLVKGEWIHGYGEFSLEGNFWSFVWLLFTLWNSTFFMYFYWFSEKKCFFEPQTFTRLPSKKPHNTSFTRKLAKWVLSGISKAEYEFSDNVFLKTNFWLFLSKWIWYIAQIWWQNGNVEYYYCSWEAIKLQGVSRVML